MRTFRQCARHKGRQFRKGAVSAALGLGLAGLGSLPALAVDLPFSANCTNYTAITVDGSNTGITFRKNPNSSATRAATATVFRVVGLNNIVLAVNVTSCFYTVTGTDNYCFQASSNPAAFMNINAVAGTNTMALPACQ
ncbi:hypothetical protein [Aquabacter spiritensis]|uniref:Uncharacterized protein n=1 Tax=Aquabacter spiritensis TaxID=933073 RepID=A0A4R3LXY0_9HYPH|nr:hypothetical protein [Aquabacter spiritensis]TCT05541.1 hypothetical protein EDC64_10498 [Aquabacter spiritensis]